ncbi:MAG: NADH:ubiquinone reductase (Na(+)-transporting) subunit C [Clostridium sp.]|nr:NADH:ubiquinone reductase (Na(+)-transporting) subunit C [Clostridium sp.]
MNKQSNTYTIIYIILLVVVVGSALALTATALKPRQIDNANADKMKQILAAVHVSSDAATVKADFSKYITSQIVVNDKGETIGDDAFDINVEKMSKEPAADRQLPVYVCTTDDGLTKYILPAYGAGLWGPIWGYVAFDSDGSTVYGAYFAHQGETPGLGAEIEKPAFSNEFIGKEMIKNGKFVPVEVVKAGQKPSNPDADYVDGISGGTITSKGVGAMLDNCLQPYAAFLNNLSNRN